MDDKPKQIYYGDVKITDGKYTDRDGKEKTRYLTIGKLYHSPHLSRISIYLFPTAMSEGKWINAYPYEDHKAVETKQQDTVIEPRDEEISLSDIPFN
jgi:hypothetical protein